MTDAPQRHLVFEVERVQTVRRRVATRPAFCKDCHDNTEFAELSDLARTFDVSVAEAVLQLRERGVHMQHPPSGSIVVCIGSLLSRSDPDNQMLTRSLPPAATDLHLTFSSE
ncbi:MAG: hypothetical protein ABL984_05035 [Pyrinomonadaceae bacterium]